MMSVKGKTQNLPEVKVSFTVGQLVTFIAAIISIVGTVSFTYYKIMTKLDDVDGKVTLLHTKINHEVSLRKVTYMQDYFYNSTKHWENDKLGLSPTIMQYWDSTLIYDPIKDTLVYKYAPIGSVPGASRYYR